MNSNHPAPSGTTPLAVELRVGGSGLAGTGACGEPYILVAEDNSGDVALIRMALTEQGVRLRMVVQPDGESAMRFLDDLDSGHLVCPALVVLDLNLPRISGREVLERLRLRDDCRHIPIVVFSSSDSARDRQSAVGLGASVYLRKPTNLEDFLEVGKLFRELLDPASGPGQSTHAHHA